MHKSLITGACGFIGSNLADRLLHENEDVILVDDLSRKGSEKNYEWLKQKYKNLKFTRLDITKDFDQLKVLCKDVDAIYHLAAQVAVTSSVENPRIDFNINALGSFNVLEAARLSNSDPAFLFASTNKVYGGMENIKINEKKTRYEYATFPEGLDEQTPLDFHSPYGCSKGCADQYVRDYERIYGLKTIVFRQSCIYGERQFGVEDQGWLAWFIIASYLNKALTIYGDGKQVRDILYIKDLLEAYSLAVKHINKTKGKAYNIGGGPINSISLLESLFVIEKSVNKKIDYTFADWRPGDQKVYVSNIAKAHQEFGWKPKTSPVEGIGNLAAWVRDNLFLFK